MLLNFIHCKPIVKQIYTIQYNTIHKWLIANNISLNDGKTELIYFRKGGPAPTLNIKLHGKTLVPTQTVKYLGVYLDEFLSGEAHSQELVKKLNRANGMLAKSRHFVPDLELKNIYHAIFSSHLMYGAQVWSTKLLSVTAKITRLQKSAMRIMTFSEFRAHSEPLFKKLNILKLDDSIRLTNCLFVYDYLNGNLPDSYTDTFTRLEDTDANCTTRQASTGMLHQPAYNSTMFGLKCIYKRCIDSWNLLTSEINHAEKIKFVNKLKCPDIDLAKISRGNFKKRVTDHILSKYEN